MNKTNIKVIDFFCGAGGFSEGFRQQGFQIVMGIDNWNPAVQTHNLNHDLHDVTRNVLEFENDIGLINALPNTEIIIGSPPCVNFSMSNRAGKADKSLGVKLIEAYLRVVAVKKHQPGSILKGWLMENVPNSRNFVQETYSFADLNLGAWARSIGRDPKDEALKVQNNGGLFTASDYGSPQSRQRFICGELLSTGEFPEPKKTHGPSADLFGALPYLTLGDIKQRMPSPFDFDDKTEWTDPNHSNLKIKAKFLTDQFYDTGVYKVAWEMARFAKVNHPFMGKMSFPEDQNRPSRTIMATRSASTREALIFRSEKERIGDGEYRLPTIREAATLMGFPFNYQFLGGEGTKWRLIGNAVCPHMAAAVAKEIRNGLGLSPIPDDKVDFSSLNGRHDKIDDLNNSGPAFFNSPPKKKKGSKFRMHPFKGGNMTVSLTNFDPKKGSSESTNGKKWHCSIFLGSGKDFIVIPVTKRMVTKVEKIIKTLPDGRVFMKRYLTHFKGKIGNYKELQSIYEQSKATNGKVLNPIALVEEIAEFIQPYDPRSEMLENIALDGIKKERFPKRQLLAIWALGNVTNKK